jgi:DNA-binding NarL/FixJ family response regulator
MPGITGVDLAEKLKAAYPEMKVMYISGYAAEHIRHSGGLKDSAILLQKPFSPEDLAQTVRNVLES